MADVFVQGTYVRDFVFPIGESSVTWAFRGYVGTGFFIGRSGYALTAAHVVRAFQKDRVPSAMFCDADREWHGFPIAAVECHPTEDVAIIQLKSGSWNSPFRLAGTWEGASCEYELWGYPGDSLVQDQSGAGLLPAPDLVYLKGYVRRRISASLGGPMMGTEFFELSQPAYPGCSGGPIWLRRQGSPAWHVYGVYVGFRRVHDPSIPFTAVGYAVREEAFREWSPNILGRSIREEAAESSLGFDGAGTVPRAG